LLDSLAKYGNGNHGLKSIRLNHTINCEGCSCDYFNRFLECSNDFRHRLKHLAFVPNNLNILNRLVSHFGSLTSLDLSFDNERIPFAALLQSLVQLKQLTFL